MKKVLVLNGSPRGSGSVTMKLVRAFLQGAAPALEAEVQVVDLRKMTIGGVQGLLYLLANDARAVRTA